MNRFRTLNGVKGVKRPLHSIDFVSQSHRKNTPTEQLLNLIYEDGKGDIALYLNENTPIEIRQALEKLLQPIHTAAKYPDDVIAFDMLPHEGETRQQYGDRLQSIINDAYKADIAGSSTE